MNHSEYTTYLTRLTTLEEGGLQQLLDNAEECKIFKSFLDEELSSEHLLFWLEAEVFKAIEDPALIKSRAEQIYSKYLNPESKYEINIPSSVKNSLKKKLSGGDEVDTTLFTQAQTSVFTLLEMDSFPRFLHSEIYLNYKASKQESDRANEDLTYLIVRARSSSRGVNLLSRQAATITYPECFVATEFVTWMVQNLYLLDRKSAIELGENLRSRGFIACLRSGVVEGEISKEIFGDNVAFWRFTQKNTNNELDLSLKTVEELVPSMPFKNPERELFKKTMKPFIDFAVQNLEIMTSIISSAWSIPRVDRDEFAVSVVKIYGANGNLLPLIHNTLDKSFQAKELGTLLYGDNSIINKIMDTYFGLIGKEYIQQVLRPLFNKPMFERELCFDLRNDAEDQGLNQLEFMRIITLVVDNALEMLNKIPANIREIASYIAKFSKVHAPKRYNSLLSGLLFRTINRALLRPDNYGVIPSPFIPLPRVRENLFLLTRVIDNLINEVQFTKGYKFLKFTNIYISAKLKIIGDFLKNFITVPEKKDGAVSYVKELQVMTKNCANFVETLYSNRDKLETVMVQIDESERSPSTPVAPQKMASFLVLKNSKQEIPLGVHNFEPSKDIEPLWCHYCGEFIWKSVVFFSCINASCPCCVHKACRQKVPENCGDTYFTTQYSSEMVLIGKFFQMMQDSHELLKYGAEGRLKLHYSPIFPNCRVVLQFLLCNNIDFQPKKIDYLYGDFKEDPILVDGDLILIDCHTIMRYLSDKYCVDRPWYPSTIGDYSQEDIRHQAGIEQLLEWSELNIKYPVHQIFWKEIFPRFNSKPVAYDRQAQIYLSKLYGSFTDALNILQGILHTSKHLFLVSDDVSIADVSIAEQLSMTRLFQNESLQSFPQVWKWYCRVRDVLPHWNEIKFDFNTFHQNVMCISMNEGIPSIHHTIGFLKGPEEVYSRLREVMKIPQGETQGEVAPERIIVQNFKAEYIPENHYSALECQLTGNVKHSKFVFSLINVPSNKIKAVSDEWMKQWRQLEGFPMTDFFSTIYFQQSYFRVWDLLLSGEKLSSLTKMHCNVAPIINTEFSLFDNSILFTNSEIHKTERIVQTWRMSDWNHGCVSSLKYTVAPMIIGEVNGCCVQIAHTNIPLEKVKEVEQKHHFLWKKIKAEEVETLQQEIHFQGKSLDEFYSDFNKAVSGATTFKLRNRSDVRESSSSITIRREFNSSSDWPVNHLSRVILNCIQSGDRDVRASKDTKVVLIHECIPKGKSKGLAEGWEKNFWKKMKGVVTVDLQHSEIFNLVSPSEVYENLLNLGKFTKKACTLTTNTEMGESFTLYDGQVVGSITKLMKNQYIMFKWSFSDWPQGHYSIVRLTLKELIQRDGKSSASTTKVTVSHEWVPAKYMEASIRFWTKFWRKFKASNGRIAVPSVKQTKVSGIKNSIKRVTSIS